MLLLAPWRLLLCILLVGVVPTVAQADDVTAAREHFRKGTKLYDLQRYREAAAEYEAAFDAKEDPALLFNIAQADRLAGDYSRAIAAYCSFLRRVPQAANRVEVEARIEEMKRLAEQEKQTKEAPPTGRFAPGDRPPAIESAQVPPVIIAAAQPVATITQPPPMERPMAGGDAGRRKRIAGIGIGAGGVVAIALGGVFVGLAKSASDEVNHPSLGYVFNPATESALHVDSALGAVFFAVGGAAVVVGTILYVLGRRGQRGMRAASSPPSFARMAF